MSSASELKNCPKCGRPIPAEAPQGLCPKCLLQQASLPTESGQGTNLEPLRIEELGSAFPNLEILQLVGRGGMGFVFKARQTKLDRFVALKILPQSLAAAPAFAERFSREGRVLARLNHPNIVTIYDFGQANGFFYLLMEFVDGVSLRQAMRAGGFTPAQALTVVPKICEALQFAHNEGILHRDIKPENILLDSKGRVKIADFGIAKLLGEPQAATGLTGSGSALGTPHYMAPEQLEHPQEVDQRADIFSLGVVFYEMLTGELPIGRFAPPSEKSAVDPRLDEVVLRTLEKERERRTKTADEVKTQVETITGKSGTIVLQPAPASSPKGGASTGRRAGGYFARALPVAFMAFLVTTAAAVLLTMLMPKSFLASTRVRIEEATPDGALPREAFDPFLIQSEVELARSEAVLDRVIEKLQLPERWADRYGSQAGFSTFEGVELLRRALEVRPIRSTMMLDIRFFSQQPYDAAAVANAIADSLAQYHSEQINEFEQSHAKGQKGPGTVGFAPKLCRVEIVDRAAPNFRSARPDWPLNIALGMLGGLFVGIIAGVVAVLFWVWRDSVGREKAAQRGSRIWRLAGAGLVVGVAATLMAFRGFFVNRERERGFPELILPDITQSTNGVIPTFTTGSGRLIIDHVVPSSTPAHADPGGQELWTFKCFVPPNHLASFLFVRWLDGVPQINSSYSAYYKVGSAGGIDEFLSISFEQRDASWFAFAVTNAEEHPLLAKAGFPDDASAIVTNAYQWNVNWGQGFTLTERMPMPMPPHQRLRASDRYSVRTGHQTAIPLLDFTERDSTNAMAKSGIELRVMLQPLTVPAIRTAANEVDRTNFIGGTGIPGTMQQTLKLLRDLPVD
jgi:serine/threonine protein kinase